MHNTLIKSVLAGCTAAFLLAFSLPASAAAADNSAAGDPSREITVNGQSIAAASCILVPVRAVAEAMGFAVEWKDAPPGVTLDNGTVQTELVVGRNQYFVSSSPNSGMIGMTAPFALQTAPLLINDTLYAPPEIFRVLSGNAEEAIVYDGAAIHFFTPDSQQNTQIPNPLQSHDTIASLEKAVGFSLPVPAVPDGFSPALYQDINGQIAEIRYTDGNDTLTYRISKGGGNNSGDYSTYPTIRTADVRGTEVTLSGNSETIHTAVWLNQGFAYSLHTQNGMTKEKLYPVIESLL